MAELAVTPQQIIYTLLYSTISIAAIGGNGIVIYLIANFRHMRTVTNYFIMNLAVGDLLMAVLCIPFSFTSNLLIGFWPFGQVMCSMVSYAQAVSVFISAYTLVAISIDRYIAIVFPLRPRLTRKHALHLIAFIWLVALLTPLPTALFSKLQRLNSSTQTIEVPSDPNTTTHSTISPIVLINIPLPTEQMETSTFRSPLKPDNLPELLRVMRSLDSSLHNSSQPSRGHVHRHSSRKKEPSMSANNVHRSRSLSQSTDPSSSPSTASVSLHYASPPILNSPPPSPTVPTSRLSHHVQGHNELTDLDQRYFCSESWPKEDYKSWYSVALMVLQYVVPFTVLVFTYSNIAFIVWGKRTPGEADDGRDARIAASKRKVRSSNWS